MTRPECRTRRRSLGISALLILCAMAAVTAPAGAQSPSTREVEEVPLHLNEGEARLEAVAEPFDTVVVGDPAVVTTSVVSATALVLTARSTGRTNIMLLDPDGTVQAKWSVLVGEGNRHRATIYRGVDRSVISCTPECRPPSEESQSRGP